MKKLMITGTVAALSLSLAAENLSDTVWRDQKTRIEAAAKPNRAKVEADAKAAGLKGDVVWYAVPAMSDRMRLMDSYPADGNFAGEVRGVLAGDEVEDASFQLFAFSDLDKVELKLSDLVCGGAKLEADIRVLKLWFQNANAWVSYFDDPGLKLVPELLLHDENLIKVDLKAGDAWARVKKDGKDTFAWLTAPKPLAVESFDPFDPGFADVETMQPVKLVKNEFKQFFVTVKAKKGQKPGVYKGKVTVAKGGKTFCEIPLAFRVLGFDLPFPAPYDDPYGLYIYDMMGAFKGYDTFKRWMKGDEAKAKEYFRKWFKSVRDHSLFNAVDLVPETPQWQIDYWKEIGMNFEGACGNVGTGWFALNFGGRMDYYKWQKSWECAKKADEFYHKKMGLKDVRIAYGDEQGANFVAAHRQLWDAFAAYGFGLGFAGHAPLVNKGGYNTDYYMIACNPADRESIRVRKESGGKYFGFYANQHTATENPQFTRRQHGLLGYLAGMNTTYNYEFAIGPFNDRTHDLYRPMVISYANSQGLMETIEYSGVREGCDDIRYATVLMRLVGKAEKSGDYEAKKLARKARLYFSLLDLENYDINEVGRKSSNSSSS